MKIKERANGDVTILALSGDVQGGPDADMFRTKIADLIEEGKNKVIVDLSDVPWMNSSGVGLLVSGFTSISNAGGQFKLLNVKERVQSILMITKLLTVFESYYSEDEAIESFGG